MCEYWNATEARWVLVDPQLDDVWQTKLHIDFDVLNVPRDRFLAAGDAWAQCRTGKADPTKFGIGFANLRGLWFVAGNLVRDVAALTHEPDASFAELRSLYESDERLRVPPTVFNALLNRPEAI